MHEKEDHYLFARELKDKKTSDKDKEQNKLPQPLLSLLLHKLPSDSLQCNLFIWTFTSNIVKNFKRFF